MNNNKTVIVVNKHLNTDLINLLMSNLMNKIKTTTCFYFPIQAKAIGTDICFQARSSSLFISDRHERERISQLLLVRFHSFCSYYKGIEKAHLMVPLPKL